MRDFVYCAPTRVVFGRDTEKQVGQLLKDFGAKRVLLQYGGGSVKRSGLYDTVVACVKAARHRAV